MRNKLSEGKEAAKETESDSKEICSVCKLFEMATGRCKHD